MEIDLRGKVAIVTGGGRGIGREIAETLAAEGCRTVVMDINSSDLEEVAGAFSAKGWQGRRYRCDVTDSSRIAEVIADVEGAFGRIDVLVNNAGVFLGGAV